VVMMNNVDKRSLERSAEGQELADLLVNLNFSFALAENLPRRTIVELNAKHEIDRRSCLLLFLRHCRFVFPPAF